MASNQETDINLKAPLLVFVVDHSQSAVQRATVYFFTILFHFNLLRQDPVQVDLRDVTTPSGQSLHLQQPLSNPVTLSEMVLNIAPFFSFVLYKLKEIHISKLSHLLLKSITRRVLTDYLVIPINPTS